MTTTFSGKSASVPAEVVQHVAQLSIAIICLQRNDPSVPRRRLDFGAGWQVD